MFNGEIYNFVELRRELEQAGVRFRGGSDTEVLLAAIERWGVAGGAAALRRHVRLRALGLAPSATLYLVRDRLGEKPLYYGWVGGDAGVRLGAQGAPRASRAGRARSIRDALALYLRHNCVPAPYSIYRGVRKVAPGTVLRDRAADGRDRTWRSSRTGQLLDAAAAGLRDPARRACRDDCRVVRRAARQVVAREMVADVPLGAFLSGGIDSSTIVALMQAQSRRPVRTFTIGFDERPTTRRSTRGRWRLTSAPTTRSCT